jgi:fructose-1-phosphate kinase PfkB-like protein
MKRSLSIFIFVRLHNARVFAYSLQALEYIHTPQADAAGFGIDVTILLKVAALDVVAQGKIAVETKWIIIAENVLPEGNKMGVIPYLHNASF